MTIPSALTLLVNVFTEPAEQARAIGVFGGCGAVGNGENLHALLVRENVLTRARDSARSDHWCDIRAVRVMVVGVLVCRAGVHAHSDALHLRHPEARAPRRQCRGP